MIGTNFSDRGNFIVTAENPAGPWSDPMWLPDVTGIDPSLFFDADGSCWVTGTWRERKEDGTDAGQAIWLGRLDLAAGKLAGPRKTIWRGAMVDAWCPEAPHLYFRNGWYHLVIAEGGTEHFHAVTVARSRMIDGVYEGYPGNPVLTHRNLGWDFPICNVGHADLVETARGEWFAVLLGSRLIGGYHKNLGRETFLVPVSWERDWPVFCPGTGKVEWTYPCPVVAAEPSGARPVSPDDKASVRDDFDAAALDPSWVFFGTPYQPFHRLDDGKLALKLLPRPLVQDLKGIDVTAPPRVDPNEPTLAFIGKRQCHTSFRMTTRMTFLPVTPWETAGLVVMQADNHQFRLERWLEDGRHGLRLVCVTCRVNHPPHLPGYESDTTETTLAWAEVDDSTLELEVTATGQNHVFRYRVPDGEWNLLGAADGRLINPESIGGMVGTVLGVHASANGHKSANEAVFDWFGYEGMDAGA